MTSFFAAAHDFTQVLGIDFSSSAIDDSDYTDPPLLFHFSPPDRPANPLRFIESKLRESRRRHVTTHAHAHTRRALARMATPPPDHDDDVAMDAPKICAFSETELIFAPAPFRGRACRPRRVFDSISSVGACFGANGSVEFEIVGVSLEHDGDGAMMADDNDDDDDCPVRTGRKQQQQQQQQHQQQQFRQFQCQLRKAREMGACSTSAIANATLLDQEHYHTLFRKLQALEMAGHNEEEDDLISPPSPARVQVSFMCSVNADSPETSDVSSPGSDLSAQDANTDRVFTSSGLSVLPTPLSSRETSPNPVSREKIEKDLGEAAMAADI